MLFEEATIMVHKLNVKIVRNPEVALHPFPKYFKGFDKVKTVNEIFGEKTKEILQNLKVEFSGRRGYMGVSNLDGHLIISAHYLKNGDLIDIYLDIIHELVHVKQFFEGKDLFDSRYGYADRPTEIEAYQYAVEEARKLGLSDKRICGYLKTEWMNRDEFMRLTKSLNVNCKI